MIFLGGSGGGGGVSKVYYGLCENVIMGNDGETNLGACNIHHFV